MASLCASLTLSGAPCRATALRGGVTCYAHSASKAATRSLARSRRHKERALARLARLEQRLAEQTARAKAAEARLAQVTQSMPPIECWESEAAVLAKLRMYGHFEAAARLESRCAERDRR